VQATVRTFDAATRSGSVLLDDGVELPYDDRAFDAGGLRLLRVGQRVRITVSGDEQQPGGQPGGRRVTFLTVATLPDPFSSPPS
jgi:cold shock CspA family protein